MWESLEWHIWAIGDRLAHDRQALYPGMTLTRFRLWVCAELRTHCWP
jgi:hypothetical protein